MAAPAAATPLPFRPIARKHSVDVIFEQLASSILLGTLPKGAALPPERVLGEQFGVSRMLLRQAIHRLESVGLVRVRQGGKTVVLDPQEAGDIRLIGLYHGLDPGGAGAETIRRDAVEKQFMQGFALIDVCARRGSLDAKHAIWKQTLEFDEKSATEATFEAFEESFWRAVAHAGQNRIFQMETLWWYDTLGEARKRPTPVAPIALRVAFYRELARLLVLDRQHVAAYYLSVASPQLDAMFAAEAPSNVPSASVPRSP